MFTFALGLTAEGVSPVSFPTAMLLIEVLVAAMIAEKPLALLDSTKVGDVEVWNVRGEGQIMCGVFFSVLFNGLQCGRYWRPSTFYAR